MLLCVIISFLLYISFILSLIIKNNNKVPIHLSQGYFILKNRWIFIVFMFLLMFITIIPLMEVIPSSYQFLVFLTCGSIGFIGASPNFKEDLEGKVHEYSAYIAIFSSQILVYLCQPLILLSWLILIICILIYYCLKDTLKDSNLLFWIETTAFLNIYLLMFIML